MLKHIDNLTMSKKKLKKEIKRLNKIIDVLLKENRDVYVSDKEIDSSSFSTVTTTLDYIGGRPNDRIV